MRSDSMRASLERVHGDTGERGGVSVESYLDRWSASGAEEDAASGVDVRSVLQRARTRRARVTSLDSGGGPCVPVEGARERERRKRRNERQSGADGREREREEGGEGELAQSDKNRGQTAAPHFYVWQRKTTRSEQR